MKRETSVSIDKMRLKTFKSVVLNQCINDHHTFEVVVDYQALEIFGTHTLEKSRELINQPIVITFADRDFLGVITSVKLGEENGFHNDIILSGYSPTILLDSNVHLQSWLHKDLASIVNDIVSTTGRLQAAVAPVLKDPIEYQCQYRESHFKFLMRLARQYNEWCYYDGVKLVFGKPRLEDPVPMTYDKEITSLNVVIQSKPIEFNFFAYNGLLNTTIEGKTPGDVPGLNELGVYSLRASKDLYKGETNNFSQPWAQDRSELDRILANKQAAAAADLHTITGTSTQQGLTVGSVIKVSTQHYVKGVPDIKRYGEYLITHIDHMATDGGEYVNRFQAIPAGVTVLPEPDIELPKAEYQRAVVLSNEDPMKKGRVQVKFEWQNGLMKSPWMWVMSPDAGRSDNVATNRGFMFIPEVGDEVMVAFFHNDPCRPFVMGSFFNGTTGTGGLENNKIKSITTRCGCTITFDDAEGKGKITISDPSGNIVTLNGDETISIVAPKSISLESKEIILNAEEKVTITGNNNVEINSENITENAGSSMELNSGGDMKVSSNSKKESHSKYSLEADNTVDINGSVTTNVKGGTINLN